jgi:hypothetical protein
MAERYNPGERSAAESDYKKKFDRTNKHSVSDAKKLKEQENTGGDTFWKQDDKDKKDTDKKDSQKGRFKFLGGRSGHLRKGSALFFVFVLVLGGVLYTSILAPNILLVNIKEMYTNDLADATVALDAYTKKMMNYKIGRSNCGEKDSIKCKLSTMSRAQKKAFEKQGFTVLGTKVEEDNLDDGQPDNDKPEERYQVTAILPPVYSSIISELTTRGFSLGSSLMSGRIDQLGNRVSSEANSIIQSSAEKISDDPLQLTPIVTGDMLYLYAAISDTAKAQVYGVFNPKSSYYMDMRFRERIKTKYNLTKSLTIGGNSESAVNKSFDSSVKNSAGGIDPITGRPDPKSGISLGSLSNPISAVNLTTAAMAVTASSSSFAGLECGWYSIGKAATNAAKQAKSATIARFAMQYLKQADAIKAGQATEMPTNVLSSKLAQATFGGYGGPNATDSSMYKSIVYGNLPIPSIYGLLYYLDTFDLIAAMAPSWGVFMASATGLAGVTGTTGSLVMPPANLTGTDRDYCLSGETLESKTKLKGESTNSTLCDDAVLAMAPAGTQALLANAAELGRRTCPPVNASDDNLIRVLIGDWRGPVSNIMIPTVKAVQLQATPVMAGLFGANATVWANAMSLLFTSQTKGVAASDALFAGTGEILGDMAMSRGMYPGNAATMAIYLAQKDEVEKEYESLERYYARQDPLNIYNKYSFLGSITRSLSPVYTDKAPLFSTISNVFSTVGSSIKQLNESANAIYYLQPAPFNPLRLSCVDPEYLAIGIMADTACNVRYAFGKQELAAQPDSVLDYMLKEHPDFTQENIQELEERLAKADPNPAELDAPNITRMLESARAAANQPQIDKKTGKAMPGSEYEKYLDYCVNRQDPWGRSGIAVHYNDLPDDVRDQRKTDKSGGIEAISPSDSGDPYQKTPTVPFPSIMEGAKADQDWYTGKKCLEQSEQLTNFRAYTMMCSVDGSMSGGVDCTDSDNHLGAAYSDAFYLNNDILYMSWY